MDIQKNDQAFLWVADKLKQWLVQDPEMAYAMGAISALTEVIKASKTETMMGLQIELESAMRILTKFHPSISVKSGAELFLRYITRTYLDIPDFQQCKQKLIDRGEQLKQQSTVSRKQISRLGEPFIRDGMVVLVHGYSRVVSSVLVAALQRDRRFTVIVTEARPEPTGMNMGATLLKHGLPVTLIPDTAVATIMSTVDLVMVGAEAVVENGGIINKVGTYQISIIAHALKKPFYVAAESFKMTRLFPLSQTDIPNRQVEFGTAPPADLTPDLVKNLTVRGTTFHRFQIDSPSLDYTPPQYITLLLSDLGVLTPSAVSDELIKLYY